jgi:endothelin-converting enzyme
MFVLIKYTRHSLELLLHCCFVSTESQAGATHCLSPACVTAAAAILTSLDASADPCEDFYQFSCGGWVRNNPIPDGKSLWGTFGKLDQQNQLVVRNVLGE